tara:strand:+ start:188 stop:490 length:303 start_codon:yes stop_codon:yes gene_type:complete
MPKPNINKRIRRPYFVNNFDQLAVSLFISNWGLADSEGYSFPEYCFLKGIIISENYADELENKLKNLSFPNIKFAELLLSDGKSQVLLLEDTLQEVDEDE